MGLEETGVVANPVMSVKGSDEKGDVARLGRWRWELKGLGVFGIEWIVPPAGRKWDEGRAEKDSG